MNDLEQSLIDQLATREHKGILRKLIHPDSSLIDFTSNDYLGLAKSGELSQRIKNRVEEVNIHNGATGSRLLSGNSLLCEELEKNLSYLFKTQACLIFNSGYSANIGVLSSIPSRHDTILYDELCHASIKDGIRLSLATKHSFRHNDLSDLAMKISRAKGKIFIAVESIYSMDGDMCPLQEIVTLSEQFNCFVILDEAHSTGVKGINGAGLAVALNLQDKIAIRIYTFGKAIGAHGACVAASKTIIDYLINFSKPFIYTTALPDHTIVALQESFNFIRQNPTLQTNLEKKISLFAKTLDADTISSPTAIQTVIIRSVNKTKNMSSSLIKKGYDVRPIFSPTVPEGTERLRICLHTFNSDSDIISLANQLNAR
jgi:8-amino-7-oxononanoate synthase